MTTMKQALLAWLAEATDEAVAETGTTRNYLRLIAYGQKTASPAMAVGIEAATEKNVTRQQLRPDDWRRLWPELANGSADREETVSPECPVRECDDSAVNPSSAGAIQ